MRNLLQFLAKHNRIFVFILLEIVALYLIFSSNNYHNTRLVKTVRRTTLAWESVISDIRNYLMIRKLNADLHAENTMLRNYIAQLIPDSDSVDIIFRLNREPDSLSGSRYEFLRAEVVNNSYVRQRNFFTLDAGKVNGVDTNMAVVSPWGVAGIIISAGDNFSVAMPVINLDFRLSAKIKTNNFFGSLSWDGSDYRYAVLNEIPQHVEINPGDTVVTTGYSAIFPEGITVGTITDFEKSGSDFYHIRLKLATDFRRIAHVYIIRDKLRLKQLETEEGFYD